MQAETTLFSENWDFLSMSLLFDHSSTLKTILDFDDQRWSLLPLYNFQKGKELFSSMKPKKRERLFFIILCFSVENNHFKTKVKSAWIMSMEPQLFWFSNLNLASLFKKSHSYKRIFDLKGLKEPVLLN